MIDEQPKIDDWIPCSRILPKEGQKVIVTVDYCGKKDTAIINYSREQSIWTDGTITAWIPFPEPYNQ